MVRLEWSCCECELFNVFFALVFSEKFQQQWCCGTLPKRLFGYSPLAGSAGEAILQELSLEVWGRSFVKKHASCVVSHLFVRWIGMPQMLILGGGFKHFYFLPLLGRIVKFDEHFSNGLKPPTRISLYWYLSNMFISSRTSLIILIRRNYQ